MTRLEDLISRAVSDETSERGGVIPPVLPKRAYAQEPGGLRRPAQKCLTLCRVRLGQNFIRNRAVIWLSGGDTEQFGAGADRMNFGSLWQAGIEIGLRVWHRR